MGLMSNCRSDSCLMVMPDDRLTLFIANTLGESILVEVLKSAVYFITNSSHSNFKHHMTRKNFMESKYCYFFIQGSGLDQLIETYALEYDPEIIRDKFNFYVRHS